MSFTKYITQQGDRWDTVAFKAYGDATKYPQIIRDNPTIPKVDVLPPGATLYIRIQDRPQASTTLLPPWKR